MGEAATATRSTPPPPTIAAPTTDAPPTAFRMVNYDIYLHARPAGLLVGSATIGGHITILLTYDANVYRSEDAEEYLNECRLATLYYFGTDESSAILVKL